MWSLSKEGRIDELVVFKVLDDAHVPAGLLKFEGNAARRIGRFAYAESYLGRPTGRPIDPIGLPLQRKWKPAHPDEVHLAFHDSGPDGWGKGVLDMAFPSLRLGMPEYLALGGPRRTGDLAYGPTPHGPQTWQPAEPLLRLPGDSDDVEALAAAARALDEGEATADHLTLLVHTSADIGGARPKARLRHKGADWIAKFPAWGDRFDDPKLEAVCLDIAAAAGVETPGHELITVRNRSVLLVRRFDRDGAGRALGYLSAGALLNEPANSYGTSKTYADIAEVGRRIGAIKTAEEMFKRFLLNSYLHNTDDHLRNHAFLECRAGWRLSPVFDVVPCPGRERHVCAPAPGLSPAWDPPGAYAAHAGFGLQKEHADAILDDVVGAFGKLDEFMDAREVRSADREMIQAVFASKGRPTRSRDAAPGRPSNGGNPKVVS